MNNTNSKARIPAFGYLRVSTEGQVDGDGLTRQRAAITEYAQTHNIRIVDWFTEEAVSGTMEAIDRPAFNAMMQALMSNGTHTVLIERLDRLARDVVVQEVSIRLLQSKHIDLVSVSEPELCSGDMYRKAMRQMMGVFAELDRESIVFKLRAARQRTREETGRCEGRKPYGHRDGEADVLNRMRDMHAAGQNWESIARTLNADGVKTRSGGQWYPATVRRIVLAAAKSATKGTRS
jgi:site-specific DNA recombinase